jgi:hypothetical protein
MRDHDPEVRPNLRYHIRNLTFMAFDWNSCEPSVGYEWPNAGARQKVSRHTIERMHMKDLEHALSVMRREIETV